MGVLNQVADVIGLGGGGDEAAAAAMGASELQASYQREALNYLKEVDALPRELREGSLKRLAGALGLEGGEGSQEELISRALRSPLYGAIMGGQEMGEEAILRNAAQTGGLRSGNAQHALYDYNVQLQNKALLESYNQQIQGLQGLAALPSLAPTIASQTNAIGQTIAQGHIGAAQAKQAGNQVGINNMLGLGQLGVAAFGAGMFSDRRLKKNIKYLFQEGPWRIYSWDWNTVAQKMGLTGSTIGCMADEVFPERPDAVVMKDCFLFVLYDKLGILPGV
jgi:hypothetical protein